MTLFDYNFPVPCYQTEDIIKYPHQLLQQAAESQLAHSVPLVAHERLLLVQELPLNFLSLPYLTLVITVTTVPIKLTHQ